MHLFSIGYTPFQVSLLNVSYVKMVIELKSLFSLQLAKDEAPKSPDCCLVCVMADIGVKGRKAQISSIFMWLHQNIVK